MRVNSPLMITSNSRIVRVMSLALSVMVLMTTVLLSQNTAPEVRATKKDSVSQVHAVAASNDEVQSGAQRRQLVTVYHGGQVTQVSTMGETVGQLLERLSIPYEGAYSLDTPADTETYNGMSVRVDWIVTNTESYTVELPYETVFVEDTSLPLGEEKVLTEGVSGQALCTAEVVYENSVESSRTVLEQEVILEPVNCVVAVGTGENAETGGELYVGENYIELPTGEVLTYTHSDVYMATAYTAWIDDMTGTTATGTKARVGAVAVDPDLIPYGTRMFIVTNDGQYIYGIATAEDCGGGVNGKHIDLFFDTEAECWQFGVRNITVYFLGDADWRGPQNNG